MESLEQMRLMMVGVGLPSGECRTYEKCRTCGQLSVREFIPYGLGMGRTYNSCMCRLTHNDSRGHEVLETVNGPIAPLEVLGG